MAGGNRSKSDKTAAAHNQDNVAQKKSPKSSANGPSGPGPQGAPSGSSCTGFLLNAVFYVALIGAAGFAAFYVQQAVDEIRQMGAKYGDGARHGAELSTKMESVAQQVESLRSNVDGLESSLSITRVELEAAVTRMKRGEVETRRVEEALQKLQNDLLRDLSEGVKEVKEAREKDFSSLERTVEERLAEVSQSISASVAEFAASQGEAQRQLADLKSRLGVVEDPALLKQELSAIVDAVAEIKTAKQQTDATANSLREQIGAVREELQTRNQEVASLSQEVQTVRSLVQETSGTLKQSLSAAETEVQTLKDQSGALQSSLRQVTDALRAAEETAQRKPEGKASEKSDVGDKVESLLARYDAHESGLAVQADAVKKLRTDLQQELEAVKTTVEELRSKTAEGASADPGDQKAEELEDLKTTINELRSKAAKVEGHDRAISALKEALQGRKQELVGEKSGLEELQSDIAALSRVQNQLSMKDSSLDQQVEELEKRLAALEDRM